MPGDQRAATATFESHQERMAADLGRRGVSDLENATIVVLPSITFPPEELKKIIGIQYYEERMLCMLLLLRRARMEIVYLTSVPIDPTIIDYYLGFLPDPEDARRRLHLVTINDPEPRALSEKLLERDGAIAEVSSALRDAGSSYLFPFNVTWAEHELSERMGIPLYGPHPEQVALGSKSGSRRVARVAGVPVLEGAEDLYSVGEIEGAIAHIREKRPSCRAVVVKLNNGFSGQGNVIIDLDRLVLPLTMTDAVFCAVEESWATFVPKVEKEGAIVEELVREPGAVSPSVQMRIFADGEYEVVSTHDQILGGPDDQVYLGCRFPSRHDYRMRIQAYGLGIARELASHGVIGSFGVDFVIPPSGNVYLTEINLRLGGTTHPFLMARFVTEGAYDMASGKLMVGERAKCYVATDNLKSTDYIGLLPSDVIGAVREAGLAYNAETETGVALHLLGALQEYGKLGMTCIGDSLVQADDLFGEATRVLEGLASLRRAT
ncbi:MAG: peptide ligase PGM1-related protein [Actinomycetota bacterium]